MGKYVSKVVFLPPNKVSPMDPETDVILTTKHFSKIQVKIIDRKSKFNLLISHGNAEDISSVYDWVVNTLLEYVNVNVVIYGTIITKILFLEYTGYGANEENFECSEQYLYNDIECVYEYLTNQLNINPKHIILYGRSLGSGPSCFLAEKFSNVGGLILNCGFMSIFRVIFKFRFTLPGDMFPNIDRMKNIKCPVVVLHSIKDDIVPFYHGKEMYKAAQNKFDPLFIDGTSHNNIDKVSDDVFRHINKFLSHLDASYTSNFSQNANSI